MRRCPIVQILSWNEYKQLHNLQIAQQIYYYSFLTPLPPHGHMHKYHHKIYFAHS